jgi:C_GCAxxG_C_C family probable redox protein
MAKCKTASLSKGSAEPVSHWPKKIEPLNEATKQKIFRVVEQSIERSSELGMNCAERTFAPICMAFEKWSGFSREIIRISSGFGGGGANTSYGLCGAVTGGLMGLGIFWGRVDPMEFFRAAGLNSVAEASENPIRRDEFYRIFNSYMREFEQSFGSVICRDLIKKYLDSRGFYIPDPRLQEERKTLCKSFSTWAASRVAQLILEGQEKGVQHMEMGHNKWNMK